MMEAIVFKAGPQVAGSVVKDLYGIEWKVLKNISNATAQPREGQYYTRLLEPVKTPVVELELELELDNRDFKIVETTVGGVIKRTLRIIR